MSVNLDCPELHSNASVLPAPRVAGPDTAVPAAVLPQLVEEALAGQTATAPDTPPPAAAERDGLDTRTLSRSLFHRFATLTPESPDYTYVRDTLIELNLPLVRYAAARFRSRNEPMEDIIQVGTIGLIKAIDRFDDRLG